MSYLEIVCWFVVGCMCLGAGYAVLSHVMAWKRCKQMGMPSFVLPPHDAKKSAEQIGRFLFYRSLPTGKTSMAHAPGYDGIRDCTCVDIMHGKCFEVVDFIRMCHSLGCEVVVREVTTPDTDIEEDPQRMKEVISRMREEAHR